MEFQDTALTFEVTVSEYSEIPTLEALENRARDFDQAQVRRLPRLRELDDCRCKRVVFRLEPVRNPEVLVRSVFHIGVPAVGAYSTAEGGLIFAMDGFHLSMVRAHRPAPGYGLIPVAPLVRYLPTTDDRGVPTIIPEIDDTAVCDLILRWLRATASIFGREVPFPEEFNFIEPFNGNSLFLSVDGTLVERRFHAVS